MVAKSINDIIGFEFDWLASDADGHVALFSTAGGGYAPEEFLRDTEEHDTAIGELIALPASTVAKSAPELPTGLKNTWRMVAERGIFAFDSDPHGGPYRLVAVPELPARVADLPKLVARVARALELHHLKFDKIFTVSEHLLRQCR
jgi:hypothetical protein